MSDLASRFDTDDGWHRVHWFRLLELLGRAAFASLLLLSTGIPNSIGAWVQEAFGLAMGMQAIVTYFSTRYRITPATVTATKGVWFRSEETIQRIDVQTVTARRPIWYRPLGLDLVTVADDAGNELEIGPVSRPVADAFTAALGIDPPGPTADADQQTEARHSDDHASDDRSGESVGTCADAVSDDLQPRHQPLDQPNESAPGESAPGESAPSADTQETIVRRVDLPLWKALVASVGDLGLAITLLAIGVTGYFGSWLVAAVVLVTLIPVPIAEVVSIRRFRLTITDEEIQVRDGIFTVEESRTNRHRSEFIRVDEPLTYRILGLERVYLGNGDDLVQVSPAQERGEWRRLAEPLLGIAPPDDVEVIPISERSVNRFRLRGVLFSLASGGLAALVDPRIGLLVVAVAAVLTVGWYPRARLRRFGLGTDGSAVMTRESFAPRRTWLHRLDRVDASNVTSTPAQRRSELATLRFSGRAPASKVRIPDLDDSVAASFETMVGSRRVAEADRDRLYPGAADRTALDLDRLDPSTRLDVALPGSAATAAILAKAPWAVLTIGLWAALMIGSRVTDPPGSLWRSPWLLSIGTALVATTAIAIVVLAWLRVRVERWSITGRCVERRYGLVPARRTTIKRSHIAAAKWSQGPVERGFGLGSVTLMSRGSTNPDLVLHHLSADDARELTDLHRRARRVEAANEPKTTDPS